ncbi:cyclic nucleotide-binding domain-containing protein [Candidatus Acetothermia bacterium]|nr:cyclic nucleotide-binding domain-containing protein [Candidatus Acetothermia bacterium]
MKQLDFNHCPFRDICFIHHSLYADSCIQTSLQMIEFERGETLFQQDSPAVGCYVLCRGQVKLLHSWPSGKRFLISILGPGDLIGEEGFFHPSYFDCAEALRRGVAVFITRDQLHTLLLHYCTAPLKLDTKTGQLRG